MECFHCTHRKNHILLNKRLSIRSKSPPWPGIRLPVSFTPALRLRKEIHTSPQKPKKLIATPKSSHVWRDACKPSTYAKHTLTKGVSKIPPTQPAIVLFGLTSGSIFCLPKHLPDKYWNTSFSSVETTKKISHSKPLGTENKKNKCG